MGKLLGGNDEAKRAAERARREQQIANDRQLASLQQQESSTGATRRNPRGRRLFVSDATQKSNLS
jgi:hypothetical protein